MQVKNETELNAAITAINGGGSDTTIEITENIALTADLVSVSGSLTLTSSEQHKINAEGYRVLQVTNGAAVTLSLSAEGTGPNHILDGTLVGKGGALGDVTVSSSGILSIPEGQTLTTNKVIVEKFGKLHVHGTLNNTDRIIFESTEFLSSTGHINDIFVSNRGELGVSSEDTLTTGFFVIQNGATSVNGTLTTEGPVFVFPEGYLNGNQGIMGDVLLIGGQLSNGANNGYTAGQVTNLGGTLHQGFGGTVNVESYTQLSGTLEVTLGQMAYIMTVGLLESSGSVELITGKIHVNVEIANAVFVAGQKFDIITTTTGFAMGPGVEFVMEGFPSGYTAKLHTHPDKLTMVIEQTSTN